MPPKSTKRIYIKSGKYAKPKTAQAKPKKKGLTRKVQTNEAVNNEKLSIMAKKVNPDPFPANYFTKLTYADRYTLSTNSTGSLTGLEKVYRLNSVWDPDFSLGGNAALYYNTISPLYRRYIVHAAEIDIVFSDPSADGMYCAVGMGYNSMQNVELITLQQRPQTKVMAVNNTGSQLVGHRETLLIHKVKGVTKEQYRTQLTIYGAAINDNAGVDVYLRLACGNVLGTAAASNTIQAMIRITYYVQFMERNVPAP